MLVLLSAAAPAAAAGAEVESFSPQDTVKGVRQVTARFREPMVAGEPFAIDCLGLG